MQLPKRPATRLRFRVPRSNCHAVCSTLIDDDQQCIQLEQTGSLFCLHALLGSGTFYFLNLQHPRPVWQYYLIHLKHLMSFSITAVFLRLARFSSFSSYRYTCSEQKTSCLHVRLFLSAVCMSQKFFSVCNNWAIVPPNAIAMHVLEETHGGLRALSIRPNIPV